MKRNACRVLRVCRNAASAAGAALPLVVLWSASTAFAASTEDPPPAADAAADEAPETATTVDEAPAFVLGSDWLRQATPDPSRGNGGVVTDLIITLPSGGMVEALIRIPIPPDGIGTGEAAEVPLPLSAVRGEPSSLLVPGDPVPHPVFEEERRIRMSLLLGQPVIGDEQRSVIAGVEDLVLEPGTGRVVYAVLSYAATLGLQERRVVVPWQSLRIETDPLVIRLGASPETLDRLAYVGGALPDLTDPGWIQKTHRAFGSEPLWQVFGYTIHVDDGNASGAGAGSGGGGARVEEAGR